MLDPRITHDDLATFDPNEEQEDGHIAERHTGASEGGENVNAGRPRLISIGFGVIRI